MLLIVTIPLYQACGRRLPRGVQLWDQMLLGRNELVAAPDIDDVNSGYRLITGWAIAASADRTPPDHQKILVVDALHGHSCAAPAFREEVFVQCPLIVNDVVDFDRTKRLSCCLVAAGDSIDQRLSSTFDGSTANMSTTEVQIRHPFPPIVCDRVITHVWQGAGKFVSPTDQVDPLFSLRRRRYGFGSSPRRRNSHSS